MDRKLEVNKWKRLEGRGAAGDGFFCSFSPSPSTTSQVCLNWWALHTKRRQLSSCLKGLLLMFVMLFRCLADKNFDKVQRFTYGLMTGVTCKNLYTLLILQLQPLTRFLQYYKCQVLVCSRSVFASSRYDNDQSVVCKKGGCRDDINTLELMYSILRLVNR